MNGNSMVPVCKSVSSYKRLEGWRIDANQMLDNPHDNINTLFVTDGRGFGTSGPMGEASLRKAKGGGELSITLELSVLSPTNECQQSLDDLREGGVVISLGTSGSDRCDISTENKTYCHRPVHDFQDLNPLGTVMHSLRMAIPVAQQGEFSARHYGTGMPQGCQIMSLRWLGSGLLVY
jgi:hypothetical protein